MISEPLESLIRVENPSTTESLEQLAAHHHAQDFSVMPRGQSCVALTIRTLELRFVTAVWIASPRRSLSYPFVLRRRSP